MIILFRSLLTVIAIVAISAGAKPFFHKIERKVKVPQAAISNDGGFAYAVSLSPFIGYNQIDGDSNEYPSRSLLRLEESNRALGPAHSIHEEIRNSGRGRFSHWGDVLIFSTSDNSNPALNGRAYYVVYSTIWLRWWDYVALMLGITLFVWGRPLVVLKTLFSKKWLAENHKEKHPPPAS